MTKEASNERESVLQAGRTPSPSASVQLTKLGNRKKEPRSFGCILGWPLKIESLIFKTGTPEGMILVIRKKLCKSNSFGPLLSS